MRYARQSAQVDGTAYPCRVQGACAPVATENRIWAGAAAAMATLIAGMIDLLKLLGGLLVGVFRSHAAREAEMAFSPPAACCAAAIRAGEAQAALCRSLDLRLALSAVPLLGWR